jgi:hypothetical protein
MEKHCCLIFVYNADSTLYAQLTDAAHKLLSPETYQCNLCKITYSAVSMKQEWKEYLQTLPFKFHFMHRDEFHEKFPTLQRVSLPAVFLKDAEKVSVFLSAEELNEQSSIGDLIKALTTKM